MRRLLSELFGDGADRELLRRLRVHRVTSRRSTGEVDNVGAQITAGITDN